jgi:hypothetical protein
MTIHDQYRLQRSNQYCLDSACAHCEGVIRHEPLFVTQSATVQYAFRVLSDPHQLSLEDELILHSLGVIWERRENSVQAAAPQMRASPQLSREPDLGESRHQEIQLRIDERDRLYHPNAIGHGCTRQY